MEISYPDGSSEVYRDDVLAGGAEGDVYLSLDEQHVFKLYHPHRQDPWREQQIRDIIDVYGHVGTGIYWSELFAWPEEATPLPRLGVRSRYSPMTRMDHYLYRRSYDALPAGKRGTWIGRVAVAIKVARTVNRLAEFGICHADLCPRNMMVDPVSGGFTLLDCDGLVLPNATQAQILGSKEYAAPELEIGSARMPSPLTDRHSLAVVLYRWLLYKHPLLGTKRHDEDIELDEKLALGERALYIEHPYDHSNRPPNLQLTADTLTPRVRDLFLRAFTEGLKDPSKRPLAVQWESALTDLFDYVIPCPNPNCEQHYFVASVDGPLRCPLCQTSVTQPAQLPYLRLETPQQAGGSWHYAGEDRYNRYIVGWPERPIFLWHADPAASPSPTSNVSAPDVRAHAYIHFDTVGQSWYLRNVGFPNLRATGSHDSQQWESVPIGGAAKLQQGTRLLLGDPQRERMATVEMHTAR